MIKEKDYQRQRKALTRYRNTDKKISSPIQAGGQSGYREGSWTAKLPRWIAAFVILGGLGLYLGSAVWIGQSRNVYLVNGTTRQYTVEVQGASHSLPPNSATPIRVTEGDLQVSFSDVRPAIEPIQVSVNTPFWNRPFGSYTFVINPDRSAIVVEEESFYAVNPQAGGPPVDHFGRTLYSMSGIDYEFERFPSTVQVPERSQVRKTRVSLASDLAPEASLVLLQKFDPQEQIQICQHVLRIDPNMTLFLFWLSTQLPPDQAIAFCETRLDEKPILVEWHRFYQTLMERAHPETDLRPRYRQLLADAKGNADALYLLGAQTQTWMKVRSCFGKRPR